MFNLQDQLALQQNRTVLYCTVFPLKGLGLQAPPRNPKTMTTTTQTTRTRTSRPREKRRTTRRASAGTSSTRRPREIPQDPCRLQSKTDEFPRKQFRKGRFFRYRHMDGRYNTENAEIPIYPEPARASPAQIAVQNRRVPQETQVSSENVRDSALRPKIGLPAG